MIYDLPTSLVISADEYEIRSDYRAVLDICCALNDPELRENEKPIVALLIFYPSFDDISPENYQEAFQKCLWFIDGGKDRKNKKKGPKLMDWKQDFAYIVGPVNQILGKEIRNLKYMHWWTFMAAYTEIGDCTFSKILSIRMKRSKGMRLDKGEREWYIKNREIVDFQTHYTDEENNVISKWIGSV